MKKPFTLAFVAATLAAHAQWVTNGNDINNTNTGNVGIGTATPSAKLDVVGSLNLSTGSRITINGLNALHMAGTRNVAIGSNAGTGILNGGTGVSNIFVGDKAGEANTTGSRNIFFGLEAGLVNTTGTGNIAIGNKAGASNTTASNNVFIGVQSGTANITGQNNNYIGYWSGRVATGSNNSFFGHRSGENTTTGENNTFVGRFAGQTNTTGSSNTYIGNSARGNADISNSTAIGFDAVVTQSNSVVIGNSLTNMGIGESAPSQKLHVAGNARITGAIFDSINQPGTPGQVLSSTGTGTQWTSVVGPTGPQGPTGAQGPQGPAGPTGPLVSGSNGQTLRNDGSAWVANSNLFNNGTNIGIGTTAPNAKLEVSDDVLINGITIGRGAGSISTNTANGSQALFSNTTGSYNSAMGRDALRSNTTGNNNSAMGVDALRSNTTGNENSATGVLALFSNTTGLSNSALGAFALYSNTTGGENSAMGRDALYSNTTGSNNSAMGRNALRSNTTGNNNSAMGVDALRFNTTGAQNSATGAYALYSNTTGSGNSTMGAYALYSNTTGSSNSAIGVNALISNTIGGQNSAMGAFALQTNTTGVQNSAMGAYALFSSTTGYSNSAMGVAALSSNTTGSSNTAMGINALDVNTIGSNNTALGSYANVSSATLSNATALGNGATVNASNKMRLGNAGVTVIEGQVAYSFPSDKRFKFNVKEEVKGLDFIVKLRPVTYQFDTKKFDDFLAKEMPDSIRNKRTVGVDYAASTGIVHTGFIAQEVEKAAQETGFVFDGVNIPADENGNYSVSYSQFVVPLVKAVQELNGKVEELKPEKTISKEEFDALKTEKDAEIAALNAKNTLMERQMAEILARLNAFDSDLQQCCFDHSAADPSSLAPRPSSPETPQLEQNQPNPFHENTTIKYYLPNGTRTASITISDLNGVLLKQFDLGNAKGFGQVLISGGAFTAGTYVYTLSVNGKVVDSKRMVLM